jgi:hypothetical protein
MIPDRCCIEPTNTSLISSAYAVPPPTLHDLTQPASPPDLAGAGTPARWPVFSVELWEFCALR